MRGFSLVEIMVVVVVLGIIATAGYPRLMGFAEDIRLEQEAMLLFSDLSLVRASAIAMGQAPGGPWRVEFFPPRSLAPLAANATGPYTGFDCLDPSGNPVRPAMREKQKEREGDADQAEDRALARNSGLHKVCFYFSDPPPPVPSVATIAFDFNGQLTSPTPASVTIRAYLYNQATRSLVSEIPPWEIVLDNAAPGQNFMRIRRP